MSSPQFAFDTEFTLLDVGATGALVRSGGVRPAALAYDGQGNVETVVLDWSDDASAGDVFEETRKWLRGLKPVAYAVVAVIRRDGNNTVFVRGDEKPGEGCMLALWMQASDGQARGALYPVRRGPTGPTLGVPQITGAEESDWCPIGDIWTNPFCAGDIVSFRPPARAVDPETPLWKAIVELTKLRVQTDRYRSQEYMLFLDDLRNGIFTVVGRSATDPHQVALKPRTTFNPVGYLVVPAAKLRLIEAQEPMPMSGAKP